MRSTDEGLFVSNIFQTSPRKLIESEDGMLHLAEYRLDNAQLVTEQYDYTPSSVRVLEHVRLKYACKNCEEKVIVAGKPNSPIEKGLAEAGMLAYVATSKFADHLPLNRLEGMFKHEGAIIARSTMCDWMAATASILAPLYELMKQEVLRSKVVWTDASIFICWRNFACR